MKPFGLVNSQVIWAVAALPLIAVLLYRLETSIRGLHREAGRIVTSGWQKRIIIPLVILALGISAAARPYYGENRVTVHGSGRDVLVLLDISLSMLAQDLSPSRLEFAKRKVLDIIRYTQQYSPEDRIGLILFAGDAYMYCPLTSDLGIVTEFLQNAGPDLISSRGSSLLRAIEVARDALKETKSARSRLIILSDGEDLESDERTIGQALQRIPGSSLFLGLGTVEGAPIPLPQGGFLSSSGEMVVTRLREEDIQRLFTTPNAHYKKASITDIDFAPFLQPGVADSLASDVPMTSREIVTYGEVGPMILIGILLFISLLALFGRERAVLLFLMFCFPALSTAQEELNDSPAYLGYQRYQSGDFQSAYDLFNEARKSAPDDPRILQSLGSAAFKLGKLDEAESHFRRASEIADSENRRFESLYDLGNAQLARKKFREAISSYDRALKLRGNDQKALHNRSIAEKLLQQEEQKKSESSSSGSSSSETSDQQNSEQNSSQSSSESRSESPGSSSSEPDSAQSDQSGSSSSGSSNAAEASKDSGSSSNESGSQGTSSSGSKQPDIEGTPSPAQPAPAGEATPADSTPLSEREAEAWLRALPESPLLIQRLNKQERKNPGEQLW